MTVDLIGVLVSALVSLGVAFWSHALLRRQDANLERDEVRKRKVEIIYQLIGARYVLSDNYLASSEEVKAFNTAMALFPIFFAKNDEVVRAFTNFKTEKSDANLVQLLRAAASSIDLSLPDASLSQVITVNPSTFLLRFPTDDETRKQL